MTDSVAGPPPEPPKPWWKDIDAVLELVAVLALVSAVFMQLGKGKIELEAMVPLLVGGLATITALFKKRATTP